MPVEDTAARSSSANGGGVDMDMDGGEVVGARFILDLYSIRCNNR